MSKKVKKVCCDCLYIGGWGNTDLDSQNADHAYSPLSVLLKYSFLSFQNDLYFCLSPVPAIYDYFAEQFSDKYSTPENEWL